MPDTYSNKLEWLALYSSNWVAIFFQSKTPFWCKKITHPSIYVRYMFSISFRTSSPNRFHIFLYNRKSESNFSFIVEIYVIGLYSLQGYGSPATKTLTQIIVNLLYLLIRYKLFSKHPNLYYTIKFQIPIQIKNNLINDSHLSMGYAIIFNSHLPSINK